MKVLILSILFPLTTLIFLTNNSAYAEMEGWKDVKDRAEPVDKNAYYTFRGENHFMGSDYPGGEAAFSSYLFGFFKYGPAGVDLSSDQKPIIDTSRLQFSTSGGDQRANMSNHNLFDTGVEANPGILCVNEKYIKGLQDNPLGLRREPEGRCYFYGMTDAEIVGYFSKAIPQDGDRFDPTMVGAKGTRFGRNMSPKLVAETYQKYPMDTPSGLEISQKLFSRRNPDEKKLPGDPSEEDGLIAAPIVNLLATAWLQAMNHDWFSHGKNSKKRSIQARGAGRHFPKGFKAPATISETPDEIDGLPEEAKNRYKYSSRNHVTHWWDASQIYGSDAATIAKVRCQKGHYDKTTQKCKRYLPNGKILVDEEKLRMHYDEDGLPITGFHDNWWLGLDLIHTLFAMEHNYVTDLIRDELVSDHSIPFGVSIDDIVFEKTRLVIAALMARIHTVEWTPAILDNVGLNFAMRTNWVGLGEKFPTIKDPNHPMAAVFQAVPPSSIDGLVGPGSLDLAGVPFTLTEEFVSVYRMHPLVPETLKVYDYNDFSAQDTKMPEAKKTLPMSDTTFRKIGKPDWTSEDSVNMMVSFAMGHPGLLKLRNHPRFMQNMVVERNTGSTNSAADAVTMDLMAVDIMRDRERGIPRYNDFRQALGLPRVESFEELVAGLDSNLKVKRMTPYQKKLVADIKSLYPQGIDQVDLLVGGLAENDRFSGYGFGNTPFHLFSLMAPRRLFSDPYYSDLYNPDVYTKVGYRHLEGDYDRITKSFRGGIKKPTTFLDVVKRHFGSKLDGRGLFNKHGNAFRPWGPRFTEVKESMRKAEAKQIAGKISQVLQTLSQVNPVPLRDDLGEQIVPKEELFVQKTVMKIITPMAEEFLKDGPDALVENKGILHACLRGKLQINDNLDPAFQKGVFKQGKTYDVLVKIADVVAPVGVGETISKQMFAMKVKGLSQHGVESPRLNASDKGDEQDFVAFNTPGQQKCWFGQSFHSFGPSALGQMDKQFMNFHFRSQVQAVPFKGTQSSCLENAFKALAKGQPYKYDFIAQVTSASGDGEIVSVEKARVERAPLVNFATLEFAQADNKSDRFDECNETEFNIWNGVYDHQPLGSLNRVKKKWSEAVKAAKERIPMAQPIW